MQIWFLSPYEQPFGQTSRTFDYATELTQKGHRVTIFTNSYGHRTHTDRLGAEERWRVEEIDGIRVVWLRTFHYTGNGFQRGINMLHFVVRAIQAQRTITDNPDVVVGDSVPPTAGLTAAFLARSKNAAFVFQVRDAWPLALVHDGGLSRWSPIYFAFRLIEKLLYRLANRICATMPFLHNHVKNSGGDPDKICWVPNGVNLAKYKDWNRYPEAGATLTAMYVGAFGVAHDAITIVRAADVLRRRGNHAYRFVFIGAGVKRRECEDEAKRLGLANTEFRDPIEKSEVPRVQADADILIASLTDSKIYEFGINLNKLYDYFASGRPVLFSGLAPNDPVKDSGAGYSVPPEAPEAMADALDRFSKLPVSERRALGALARQYAAEKFDVKLHGDRMEQLLRDAAGAVRPPRAAKSLA